MDFKKCESLTTVDTSNWDLSKVSKMVMLDTMNFNQIQWCKERNIIENLPLRVAKQLNMCPFYAIIDSSLVSEFESL